MALGPRVRDPAQDLDRCRVGPVQVFEGKHDRLNARSGYHPVGQRRQLSTTQFLWRQSVCTSRRLRNVEERGEQFRILRWVKFDLRKRVLKIGEALLRRHIGPAETHAAPFGDRIQRRVLQKLRAAPFGPGVRHLAYAGVKFLDKPGFTETRFPDN